MINMFENRVLRRIFGHKRGDVTGGWRKLHNEVLHNLHSLQNIVRMPISVGMSCAGHVALIGNKKYVQNFGCRI
jgi:hypothetical protein